MLLIPSDPKVILCDYCGNNKAIYAERYSCEHVISTCVPCGKFINEMNNVLCKSCERDKKIDICLNIQ